MDTTKKSAAAHFLQEFHTGRCRNAYRHLGSSIVKKTIKGEATEGVSFAVWAPHAAAVRVVGTFNHWGEQVRAADRMRRGRTGIWRCFIPGLHAGDLYKYAITFSDGSVHYKSDPMAFYSELRPGTASVIYELEDYPWTDGAWLKKRGSTDYTKAPIHIYELHLGSWRRGSAAHLQTLTQEEQESRRSEEPFLNYREIADQLSEYLMNMHYTHVEMMPICEHPLDGSWGYQTLCYYSITSRYGTPDDFRYFVNRMHACGIGVIADWVPGHFCKDASGLYRFDGSFLYEPEKEILRENRQWGTANFDLGKNEVQSFLISNAIYFLREYHIDGLRVDAVANMLYLDYAKSPSPELKNIYGGNENIDGIHFLRCLNRAVFAEVKNPLMIAEDSSSWPLVTKPDYVGGLGFNFKWNMGWMNDTLAYVGLDPIYRKWHHNKMTFSLMYAFSENYILPLSHDEVVHGKKSMLNKMFGTYEQKFDALRCFYTYMMAHPGKKLLFMGGEFGQFVEWRYYEALDWKLLLFPKHEAVRIFVSELNYLYKHEKALFEQDCTYDGFRWIDADNSDQSVFSFIRYAEDPKDFLVVICNFTPVAYEEYKIGVPRFADYRELINSDAVRFGGGGMVNEELLRPKPQGWNGQPFHISFRLPAGGAVIFQPIFPGQ